MPIDPETGQEFYYDAGGNTIIIDPSGQHLIYDSNAGQWVPYQQGSSQDPGLPPGQPPLPPGQPPIQLPPGNEPPPVDDNSAVIAGFAAKTGRNPTQWELDWANQPSQQQQYGGVAGALSWQADRLANVSHRILANAKALGITIDIGEANRMRDQYMPQTGSSSDSEINEAMSLVLTDLGQRKTKELTESIVNPPTPKKPEVTDEHKQTVVGIYNDVFGRAPTQRELDYFGGELASGASPYEMETVLRNSPEYQKKLSDAETARVKQESAAARQSLADELLKQEDVAYERTLPQIIGAYMRAGRLGSSGLDAMLARTRADMAREREGRLANIAYEDAIRQQGYGREDFVNRNTLAFQNYLRQSEPRYQQQFAMQNIGNQLRYQAPFDFLSRLNQLQDARTQRGYGIEDYNIERNDYNRYLSEAKKSGRQNALYGFFGNVLGAGLQGLALRGFRR